MTLVPNLMQYEHSRLQSRREPPGVTLFINLSTFCLLLSHWFYMFILYIQASPLPPSHAYSLLKVLLLGNIYKIHYLLHFNDCITCNYIPVLTMLQNHEYFLLEVLLL